MGFVALRVTMDRITAEKRSWNMIRIRGTDTQLLVRVRSIIHRLGFRFSLHRRDLPGKPDIVLPRHGAVVFVHGCFWHRHRGCANSVLPKTRPEFWAQKLSRNVDRDKHVRAALKKLGWRVLTIWECEVPDTERLREKLLAFLSAIEGGR